MDNATCFEVSIKDGIAHLNMNRPDKFNSMTRLFWKELPEIVKEIDKNAQARVILLTGEGKHFSSGMDLANFSSNGSDKKKDPARMRETFYHEILELQDTFTALEECRLPTIAAIQGACVGGGIDMVTACDMRYCSSDAFFKIAEVDIGLAADVGTLQRLPSLIPIAAVRELAYTGRKFDAAEAKTLGLVNDVFTSREELMTEVEKIAKTIASKSPLITRIIKKQINYARDHSVKDALDYHAAWNSSLMSGRDMEAAMTSFMNKEVGEYDDLEELKSFWEKDGLVP
ncbi:crotonase/enoyl-CoA hydratase family protein [Gammaproteobacteria bacterium]|jgi:enoyl-CoA hydratase|nr:crotonase/enoyl-CoA hydratase family protein [Gammaproteobacteria bacterium]MDA9112346.1 crotonase/enoyl-CoA hydratase family protein [Gammaproteobacteria bacterium]MDB4253118.1 crotonase/enoyl-CoA hydratase family protein [Gammaproteobacteria bacterium]MDB9997134.1 crotonase/enoyl-CoA hydratase family protein [Gammaproteobacteria bacterium]MDC1190645.1 crotonase/enoyl-CoA hydratase family protein [Gammaproteobacteria bacterium]|tara:strand:- start:139 stop:996 length:858 start_codon:yes stop_codon:yes gene_type:complete